MTVSLVLEELDQTPSSSTLFLVRCDGMAATIIKWSILWSKFAIIEERDNAPTSQAALKIVEELIKHMAGREFLEQPPEEVVLLTASSGEEYAMREWAAAFSSQRDVRLGEVYFAVSDVGLRAVKWCFETVDRFLKETISTRSLVPTGMRPTSWRGASKRCCLQAGRSTLRGESAKLDCEDDEDSVSQAGRVIVSIDVAVHHASRREKFATGSDEWSIVTALEYLFEHLTVRDEQQLLLILAPHLFATYEDDPPREIRLPVDGSIGFEIAAVARRVRRVWNPLDGGCSPPEPGAG